MHLNNKDYEISKEKINGAIDSVKKLLKIRPWGNYNDYYNNILLFGIIFKSILDLIEIIELTNDKKWVSNEKLVEEVWCKMLDCKERTQFVKDFIPEEYMEFVMHNIGNLERVFKHNYGDSLYMSVEFVYDPICNICFGDIRTCEHEKDKIYNGKLCKILRKDLKMEMTNVVSEPRDYRCRIWAWNYDGRENTENTINSTFTAPILTLFTVDNFLDDDQR